MDRVFVLAKSGQPLMPTQRFGKVRRMLKDGQAKVISHAPFTIQLQYETTPYVQVVTLGIDAGYETIGYSAVSNQEELIGGEVRLLKGMSERLKERAMYRRQRRNRKRHRPARFDFRTKGQDGWLAPSIRHKLETHQRFMAKIKAILPVRKIFIEVANFDIQAIKDPNIAGVGYQQGEQAGFWNLREYILHRDGHHCQNPACQNRARQPVLQVHHLGYWEQDRSDRPANLITLCNKCHTPPNHQPGGLLWGWKPKLRSFKPETFMSTVRWRLVDGEGVSATYGYLTKAGRIEQGLEKSHHNDAFVIAGGNGQTRCVPTDWEQLRRHNRNLERFYDAKYVDLRDGQEKSGKELSSGRRTRNRTLNGENLRQYRARRVVSKSGKISKGQRRIRRQRYPFQAGDIVAYNLAHWEVGGNISNGQAIVLKRLSDGMKTYPSPKKVTPVWNRRGLVLTTGLLASPEGSAH